MPAVALVKKGEHQSFPAGGRGKWHSEPESPGPAFIDAIATHSQEEWFHHGSPGLKCVESHRHGCYYPTVDPLSWEGSEVAIA